MKKFLTIVISIIMISLSAACSNTSTNTTSSTSTVPTTAPTSTTYEIKLATVGNEQHQSTIAAEFFKEKAEELSNGQLKVVIYPNGSLGGEREAAEGVKLGTIQMTVVTTDGALPAWVPQVQVLSIPYLFANKEEAYDVLDNLLSETFQPLFEEQGFKHLAFSELGFRHFTNNVREVKSASDMVGLSIRVQEAPIWFALTDSLGATATPVAFNELYTALQQGMVDGQENPITSIASSRFNEVQKYMVLDGHTYAAQSIIMNKSFYDSLSADLQSIINEASKYASTEQRKVIADNEADYLASLVEAGMIVTEPDLDSFVVATNGLYLKEEVKKIVDPSLVEDIINYLASK